MTLDWSPLTRYRSPPARKRHSSYGSDSVLVLTSSLVCALKHSVSGHVTGRRQDFLGQEAMDDERGKLGDHSGSPGATEIAFPRVSRVPISGRREAGVSIL